jgi:hypothetical protein
MFNRKQGHKYNATKVTIDGITFDSKLEANCYKVLKPSGLPFTTQDTYEIQEGFKDNTKSIRPITYKADFTVSTKNGQYVLDSKGMITPEFALKRKLLLYKGTRIICVGSMKKMQKAIDLINEGKSPFEVQVEVEKKTKKKAKKDTK